MRLFKAMFNRWRSGGRRSPYCRPPADTCRGGGVRCRPVFFAGTVGAGCLGRRGIGGTRTIRAAARSPRDPARHRDDRAEGGDDRVDQRSQPRHLDAADHRSRGDGLSQLKSRGIVCRGRGVARHRDQRLRTGGGTGIGRCRVGRVHAEVAAGGRRCRAFELCHPASGGRRAAARCASAADRAGQGAARVRQGALQGDRPRTVPHALSRCRSRAASRRRWRKSGRC